MNLLRTATVVTAAALALAAGAIAAVPGIGAEGNAADAASEAPSARLAWDGTRLALDDAFSARTTRDQRARPLDVERPHADARRGTTHDTAVSSCRTAVDCGACEDGTSCTKATQPAPRDSCGCGRSGGGGKTHH